MTQLEKYSLHLPYGIIGITQKRLVRVVGINYNKELPIVWEAINSNFKGICGMPIISEEFAGNNGLKYLLHPLSDLTKPITQKDYNDGKPFVPIDALIKAGCVSPTSVLLLKIESDNNTIQNMLLEMNFETIQQLLKWHFAIGFERGEFIEVTNENNPY